jgi:hypothetical protein
MMCVEVTVVPQCRVGLAPTASLMSCLVLSGGDRHRVVGAVVAVIGSHLRPVVMTVRCSSSRTAVIRASVSARFRWV